MASIYAHSSGVCIDGEWEDTEKSLSSINPYNPDAYVTVEAASHEHVVSAFQAAQDAQRKWEGRGPRTRSNLLDDLLDAIAEHRDTIVEHLVYEAGSTINKAEAEVDAATGIIEQARGYPGRVSGSIEESNIQGKTNYVEREPAGVVAAVTAWNFPFHLAMRVIAPAIALGNSVVFKPAPETPISGGIVPMELLEEVNIPDGLVNLLCGSDNIGSHVSGHPASDVVCFTGSSEVGKEVGQNALKHLAEPSLELGGNGPQIVLEDANIEKAAEAGVFGSVWHAGQVCTAINRHIVHESVYDEYVEELTRRMESLTYGEPDSDLGPLISKSQIDRLERLVKTSTQREFASDEAIGIVGCGTGRDELFYEPTVIRDANNELPICEKEHFGPVAPVIPVSSTSEAVHVANDTEKGLSASVWTESHDLAFEIANELESGMIHVNDHTIGNEAHVPFGGQKDSGVGTYNDSPIIEHLTEYSVIADQREYRDYSL